MRAPTVVVLLLAAVITAGPAAAGPSKAQARIDAAAATYEVTHARMAAGAAPLDDVYRWSVRWLDAQRELPLKGKALIAAAQAHLDRMIALEAEVTKGVNAGVMAADARTAAAYYRAEAELWVERKGKR